MSNANTPAFPTSLFSGLTKRELFAAMAMQGLISGGFYQAAIIAAGNRCDDGEHEETSSDAVKLADALLAELEKGGSE